MGVSCDHSVAEGVEDAREEIFDRGYTYHVLGDCGWGGSENSCDLADAFVLGRLECVD